MEDLPLLEMLAEVGFRCLQVEAQKGGSEEVREGSLVNP